MHYSTYSVFVFVNVIFVTNCLCVNLVRYCFTSSVQGLVILSSITSRSLTAAEWLKLWTGAAELIIINIIIIIVTGHETYS